MMTEWELQCRLTERWAADGIRINGRLHFLAAWEVMSPSWRINDSRSYWSEPSIDFLVADECLNLTAVELKRSISGVKPCWLALSQVTHRVVELLRTISPQRLERAYTACWSGNYGRIHRPMRSLSLAENHRQFFGLTCSAELKQHEIRRCVAAFKFGPSWPAVLSGFNQLVGDELQTRIRAELTSKAAEREANRLTSIPAADLDRLHSPVISLEVLPEVH